MEVEVIQVRIEELEHEVLRAQDEIDKLEKRKIEIKGAVREMWRWLDTLKDAQGYGKITFDGKTKVMKLPTLGSPEAIKHAIENRGTAIDGEDEELAFEVRMDRARHNSKWLIEKMDGESPFNDKETDSTGTEPDAQPDSV